MLHLFKCPHEDFKSFVCKMFTMFHSFLKCSTSSAFSQVSQVQLSNRFHHPSGFHHNGCFTFGDEGSRVMSVDSLTGDCALSGLFVGVILTVSSGTVRGCDG